MDLGPARVTRAILYDLLDDRIRFHEVVWSLRTNQFPAESPQRLRAAAAAAALGAAERGWISVLACADWEKQRYAPVPAEERERIVLADANWEPEAAGPTTYWFDLTPAGEAEIRRLLEEEGRCGRSP